MGNEEKQSLEKGIKKFFKHYKTFQKHLIDKKKD